MFIHSFPRERKDYHEADVGFMRSVINDTWFLDRALVSDDYDESLRRLSKHIDFKTEEYPTGQDCWMWTLPPKWTVKKALLKTLDGKIIANYHRNPLELWSYSDSFEGVVKKEELLDHLKWNPARPDDVIYFAHLGWRHWEKNWGFCVPYHIVQNLKDAEYRVEIHTGFSKSTMKVINCMASGNTDRMVVLSGHWDHPAMCNDGLVGCVVSLDVIRRLRKHKDLRYNYHAILTPEFVGSTAWLFNNQHLIGKISEGLFVAMMGSKTDFALQRSFRANSRLERIVKLFLKQSGQTFQEGSCNTIVNNDEKSFDAPGVNISMSSISRYPFPEYHTDKDSPDNLHDDCMIEGSDLVYEAILALEADYYPKALFTGLPCLSKPQYNLYITARRISHVDMSAQALKDAERFGYVPKEKAAFLNHFMTTVINYMDGKHSILDIAEIFDLPFFFVWNYLKAWEDKGLIQAHPQPLP